MITYKRGIHRSPEEHVASESAPSQEGYSGMIQRISRASALRPLRCPIRAWLGALVTLGGLAAQSLLNGPGGAPNLPATDLAVLEARESRRDLPCVVTPQKPSLGFDLRFHSGFDISIPLKELAGLEDTLTILFRVAPAPELDSPVYFVKQIHVPPIEDDARGNALLEGSFDLGEGKYHVDWLMKDRAERVCSSFWDSEAELGPKDKGVAVALEPDEIAPTDEEPFEAEPFSPRRPSGNGLNLKVLVNFAPQKAQAATLQDSDISALVSLLRVMQRDARVVKFSVVAFNSEEQKILYRQEDAAQIDFPAIGEAVRSLHLGRVDIARLAQKNSDVEFLSNLLVQEIEAPEKPDALVIIAPKTLVEEPIPAEKLKTSQEPDFPVFYLNYNLTPTVTPWRDAISAAVRFFKGQEYTISKPRDLWFAVTELVGKVVRSKAEKQGAARAAVRQGS